jgi:hypothetical protein
VALAALAPAFPARAAAPEVPALTHVWMADGIVHAATDPDSAGVSWHVRFDAAARRWSRPAPGDAPPGDSLGAVRVFTGGLFDKYPGVARIDLGGGFTLTHPDSGYALWGGDPERDLGWPRVREDDIDTWGGELRLGLPRDYPEDRLRQLLFDGRLRNVPGPFTRTGTTLWFGLAGGFAGGVGQLGGLVAYDPAAGFRVVRHKFIVDAAVTRLFAMDDELWIGTARYGPTALEGLRGLLLYRPARREWRQYSIDNSRISGNLVWDIVAESDRYVWITTDRGVSRYDRTRLVFDSWYWHPAKDGGWQLTERLPENLADELIR